MVLLPTEKNLRYHQNFKTSSMSVAVKTGIYSAWRRSTVILKVDTSDNVPKAYIYGLLRKKIEDLTDAALTPPNPVVNVAQVYSSLDSLLMLHTDRTVTVIMNNGHKFTASRATGGNNQSLHNPNDLSDIVSVLAMPNGAFVCFNPSEAFVVNGMPCKGAVQRIYGWWPTSGLGAGGHTYKKFFTTSMPPVAVPAWRTPREVYFCNGPTIPWTPGWRATPL